MNTPRVFVRPEAVAADRMARYGATYVLSSGGNPCEDEPSTDFSSSPAFETVYDDEGVTIWRLTGREGVRQPPG